jgi:hypothetical protein
MALVQLAYGEPIAAICRMATAMQAAGVDHDRIAEQLRDIEGAAEIDHRQLRRWIEGLQA